MRRKFFLRNFIMFIIPILAPIILLGGLTTLLSQQAIKKELDFNNQNSLLQAQERMEDFYQDINTIQNILTDSATTDDELKEAFSSQQPLQDIPSIIHRVTTFFDSMVGTNPQIHSISIYYNNEFENFIYSPFGVFSTKDSVDYHWITTYQNKKSYVRNWTELRNIKKYAYRDDTINILSLYRQLDNNQGVIVMNLHYDYLQKMLNNFVSYPEHQLIVYDGDNNLILSSQLDSTLPTQYHRLAEEISTKNNVILSSNSAVNNWQFVSIIPKNILYRTPTQIIQITLLLVIVFGLLGTALTYYQTKNNYKLVMDIISITEKAERGEELPSLEPNSTDQYQYIVNNILSTFVEQSSLKLQLSEKKYHVQSLELHALQSQINPHFLNNTLHSIYWEAFKITKQPNTATMMIEKLSDILNYAFQNANELVSLSDEIEYTKNYLKIMNIRYRNQFEVIWNLQENALDAPIIKLLLQPLVENSIYHGIRDEQDDNQNGNHMKIRIHKKHNVLHIIVVDNGKGMPVERLKEVRNQMHSQQEPIENLGLYNTYKRLSMIYQERLDFSLLSREGFGTAIHIRISDLSPSNTKSELPL